MEININLCNPMKIFIFLISLSLLLGISSCKDEGTTPDFNPSTPNGISPVQGTYVDGDTTIFIWAGVQNAAQYDIAIASDSLFENPIFTSTINKPTIQVAGLPRIVRLYWRIRSLTSKGNPSSWSQVFLFSRFCTFVKTFSGDTINSMQQTSDSGYVLGVSSDIIKLNKKGELVWRKTYNSPIVSVKQTSDGGFVAVGPASSELLWIMKSSNVGDVLWEKEYGSQTGTVSSMCITKNGNIVCTGGLPLPINLFTGLVSQGWIFYVNSNGDTLWSNFNYYADSYAMVIGTNDGNIAICGSAHVNPYGWGPALIMKMDISGNVLWSQSISGGYANSYSISEFEDGSILFSYYNGGTGVIKLDVNGTILEEYPIDVSSYAQVQALQNGEWVIYGYSNIGYYLKRYSASGQLVWEHIVGSGTRVISCFDGGFLVAGASQMIKTDSQGDYIQN